MIDQYLIDEFIEHRRQIKKPMTPLAIKKLTSKLEKAEADGHDIELLLDNSMLSGWSNIYPNESTKLKQGFIEKHQNTDWANGLDNVRRIK